MDGGTPAAGSPVTTVRRRLGLPAGSAASLGPAFIRQLPESCSLERPAGEGPWLGSSLVLPFAGTVTLRMITIGSSRM